MRNISTVKVFVSYKNGQKLKPNRKGMNFLVPDEDLHSQNIVFILLHEMLNVTTDNLEVFAQVQMRHNPTIHTRHS